MNQVQTDASDLKLVIYPAVEPERLEKIVGAAGGMMVVNAKDETVALAEIADADALYGRLTEKLLAAAKQLRWVQSPTASLEHYVFDALVEHPCVLTNMRGLYGDVIADHVFGVITCFARNLHLYIRQQIEARWQPVGSGPIGEASMDQPFFTGPATVTPIDRAHRRLADCVLGVVGLGHIGSEIARRGVACGMRVLAVDPITEQTPEGASAVWKMDRLSDLLAESDFVVIAAPHTPQTEGLFDRALFQRMKRDGYLINIGRGAIVRLNDLVEALRAEEIAGAGLDVFEIEPLPPEHPLWAMENVILTPHVAACTPRIAERHLETTLENVRRFVRGESLMNVVDKAKWF